MTLMTGHPDVEKSHFGHPQPFEQEQTEVTEEEMKSCVASGFSCALILPGANM